MTLQRMFLWGVVVLSLAMVGLWWHARTPLDTSLDTQSTTNARPPQALSQPAEAETAESDATPGRSVNINESDIDSLWQRYETLNDVQPQSALPEAASNEPEGSMLAEQVASNRTLARQARREMSRQRRAVIAAARDDVLARINSLEPNDIDGMTNALLSFNQQLAESDVELQLDVEDIRRKMIYSQRLSELSQAVQDETMNGERLDVPRMQALTNELVELQRGFSGLDDGRTRSVNESP